MQDNIDLTQEGPSLLRDRVVPIAVILVLILVIVFFMFQDQILGFLGFRQEPQELPVTVLKELDSSEFDLEGNIYLTMRSLENESEIANKVENYIFDTETYEFKKFFNAENATFTGLVKMSSDAKKMVFSLWAEIFTRDLISEEIKQITDDDVFAKQIFDWSLDGQKVAYMADSKISEGEHEAGDFILPDFWEIYVTDLEGSTELVTHGSFPLFSPDGKKLLFLKSNGLYLVNIESKESSRVWSMVVQDDEPVFQAAHIGLSQDRTMLAWMKILDKKMALMRIISWDPFGIEFVNEIDAQGFWPVFSPDGRYLAMEEVDLNEQGNEFINPRLVFYDLETFEKEATVDLSQFDQSAMWITDWK